ncbi:MAG TPA: hypothetical protein PKI01_11850 [Bacteroidales bacterium]|nr:hypothetical protein [Bacteroidales bacterium]
MKKIEENINQLKVIVHPVRYAIIVLIMVNKRMNVTEIYNELSISQTVASGHLKLLSVNDFLCVEKVGKNSYYTLNYKTIKKMTEAMRPAIN